jgi:hypothetical protein
VQKTSILVRKQGADFFFLLKTTNCFYLTNKLFYICGIESPEKKQVWHRSINRIPPGQTPIHPISHRG